MCSSLLQLAPGSRDLSQAEKRITEQIHKMTIIFTQNDNFVLTEQCVYLNFAQLYITFIIFSA